MIVMGCAIENLTLLAIFRSKKRFDMRAMASWAALMPINLGEIEFSIFPCWRGILSDENEMNLPFRIWYWHSILLCCSRWDVYPPVDG
jgi:hypothetical protein